MKRTYKLTASRGNQIVFDDRLEADNPRHARREMKRLLGLDSLSGIVYSLTEIPEDLIRQIVDARIAELAGGAPLQAPVPADVEELVMARLNPILRRLAALEGATADPARPGRFDPLAHLPELNSTAEPDWTLVARHLRRYRDPARTAAKYGLPLDELNARAAREGWAS